MLFSSAKLYSNVFKNTRRGIKTDGFQNRKFEGLSKLAIWCTSNFGARLGDSLAPKRVSKRWFSKWQVLAIPKLTKLVHQQLGYTFGGFPRFLGQYWWPRGFVANDVEMDFYVVIVPLVCDDPMNLDVDVVVKLLVLERVGVILSHLFLFDVNGTCLARWWCWCSSSCKCYCLFFDMMSLFCLV